MERLSEPLMKNNDAQSFLSHFLSPLLHQFHDFKKNYGPIGFVTYFKNTTFVQVVNEVSQLLFDCLNYIFMTDAGLLHYRALNLSNLSTL